MSVLEILQDGKEDRGGVRAGCHMSQPSYEGNVKSSSSRLLAQ